MFHTSRVVAIFTLAIAILLVLIFTIFVADAVGRGLVALVLFVFHRRLLASGSVRALRLPLSDGRRVEQSEFSALLVNLELWILKQRLEPRVVE